MPDVLTTELDPERGTAPLHKLLRRLRDEVAAANFNLTRGQNRYYSLVVAKLEEAEGLAILAGVHTAKLAVVNRAEILRQAFSDTTSETDNGEASRSTR